VLSLAEFGHAVAALGANLTVDELVAVFRHFDPNGSGTVDYGEFLWAFFNRRRLIKQWKGAQQQQQQQHGGSSERSAAQLRAIFHAHDSSGDGRLNARELRTALAAVGVQLQPWEVQGLLERFDIDHDDCIDYSEFIAYMEAQTRSRGSATGSTGALSPQKGASLPASLPASPTRTVQRQRQHRSILPPSAVKKGVSAGEGTVDVASAIAAASAVVADMLKSQQAVEKRLAAEYARVTAAEHAAMRLQPPL
jgi:Ca2+-binding EF-hand superfamily protein